MFFTVSNRSINAGRALAAAALLGAAFLTGCSSGGSSKQPTCAQLVDREVNSYDSCATVSERPGLSTSNTYICPDLVTRIYWLDDGKTTIVGVLNGTWHQIPEDPGLGAIEPLICTQPPS
jgi:hypothetical protein